MSDTAIIEAETPDAETPDPETLAPDAELDAALKRALRGGASRIRTHLVAVNGTSSSGQLRQSFIATSSR